MPDTTKGAVGAETKTAGEIIANACKPWERYTGEPPDDGIPLSGAFVAGMVHMERLLAKLLDVTHYEGGHGSEDFDRDATQTLRNILAGAGLWDADENRSTAPAPTPPVPDSLRALLEEARSGLTAFTGGVDGACSETIARIDALLSTHPAGQSAGSGAETRDRWLDWRGAVEGMEQSIAAATKAAKQFREGSNGEQTGEDFAKHVCWMLGLDHVWQHVAALRVALAAKQAPAVADALRAEAKRLHEKADALTAPDSTRTGDEGTEGLPWLSMKDAPTDTPIIAKHKPNSSMPHGWVAVIRLGHRNDEEAGSLDTILHYNGNALYGGFHGCWDGWLPLEALAARPADPEAQGAWLPISTAPKEKGLLWLYEPHGLGGFMYAGAWNGTAWKNNLDYADQQPSHWMPLPPAPPASSGQGGR